jgi:hypothetical protein
VLVDAPQKPPPAGSAESTADVLRAVSWPGIIPRTLDLEFEDDGIPVCCLIAWALFPIEQGGVYVQGDQSESVQEYLVHHTKVLFHTYM